jgi:NAD(P)-dependent dehydrogenase (short-subunit alcohol dehydrogenase family)
MAGLDFSGRVAVVTGSGGGLGRAYVQLLAERGASVVVNDIVGAEEAEAELVAEGYAAIAVSEDISKPAGAKELIGRTIEEYGKLDVLVNNAAVARHTTIAEATIEEWELVRSAGLDSTFYVTREAWPHMVERGYGRIVMTTSANGLLADIEAFSYAATKAGTYGMMRACYHEGLTRGIKANALAPAAFTPMAALRTSPERGEAMRKLFPTSLVAPAAVVLCSEECPVDGAVIEAGGGRVGSAFFALTSGIYDAEMTPESLLAEWPGVVDRSDPRVYESAREAMGAERETVMRRAGLDPGAELPAA